MLTLILLVFALVFFILAAFGVPSSRYNLIAAGLACWVTTEIFAGRIP